MPRKSQLEQEQEELDRIVEEIEKKEREKSEENARLKEQEQMWTKIMNTPSLAVNFPHRRILYEQSKGEIL